MCTIEQQPSLDRLEYGSLANFRGVDSYLAAEIGSCPVFCPQITLRYGSSDGCLDLDIH